MSHNWTFSPSSEAQLRRCIDAAAPQDDTNKWFRVFGKKNTRMDNLYDITALNSINNNQEATLPILHTKEDDIPVLLTSKIDEELFTLLEAEPTSRFDFLVEECLKDQNLYTTIAQRLSNAAVEKICEHLFCKKHVNETFLDNFYQKFFPTYLKREPSRFSFNLLVKSHTAYPLQFRELLKLLLKDLELSNEVLHDFVQSFEENTKQCFVNILIETELNTEEFVHNLLTIYTIYKDCKKTESIQSFMLHKLIQNSEECATENNYGRLLLAFLRAQKDLGSLNDRVKLEKVIEMHRTHFRKPCMKVFKEILEKYNT